ncbi:MAG: hypothetical protein Q4G69_00845 [Planctomycetia bacterium]|nr:hypothetical protein [Planctomycetia bacterium]
MKIISRETDHLYKRIVYEAGGERKILVFPCSGSFEEQENRLLINKANNRDPITADPVPNTKTTRKKTVK